MLRAIIYARISTNKQEDNYSIATQISACRAYAAQHGMHIVDELDETASGGTLNRTALDKARTMIRDGMADVLIVYSLDRLSRSLADTIFLRHETQQHGATIHTVARGASDTSAEGGLFDNIESAFAEYERLRIRERLQRGRLAKITGTADKPAQIYGNGNCPYGYRYEGSKRTRKLVIDEMESLIIQRMFLLSKNGMSVEAIAERLNDDNVPTPGQRGRSAGRAKREKPIWIGAMVWRKLRSEVYVGTMYFNRFSRKGTRTVQLPREHWIPVPVPAIVSRELFDAVQVCLENGRKQRKGNAKHFYLLGRGKLKCSCGYTMTGVAHGWEGYKKRWYGCGANRAQKIVQCTLGQVKADTVESTLWAWLYEAVTPEAIQAGIAAHQQRTANERTTIEHRIASLDKRRSALDREAAKMIAAYKADALSLDELKHDKAQIDAERKQIEHEYARLDSLRRDVTWHDGESLLAEAADLRAYMPYMNDEEKAALLDRIHLQAERRINEAGEQVIAVQCRLGTKILPLTTPTGSTPPDSASGSGKIELQSGVRWSSHC